MTSLYTFGPGNGDGADYVSDRDRLAALAQSGLRSGGPEEQFDRLTRLAARLLDAPIARLSLVDEVGQHFKSATGALPSSGRSTPLSHSICKHVVEDQAPVCIPDTAADERVAGNGAVTEHGAGAYLGQPVHSPDGEVLGALCVVDPHPRAWTDQDREVLADLAAAVDTELALRAALEASHARVYRDALTGLGNRRAVAADLDAAMASGRPMILVLADLDGFKAYNDRHGHAAGDRMLTRLARGLAQTATQLNGRAYRMSGDEFCVICEQPPDTAGLVAQQVAHALQRTTVECPIGASAGSVCLPDEAGSAAAAMDLADERMYARKRNGRLSTTGQVRNALRSLLAMRDGTLTQRSAAAAQLAARAAQTLGFDSASTADVIAACELSDIGLLSRPDSPTLREHPIASEQVIQSVPALAHISPLIRAHHERVDGTGFPDHIAGPQLGLDTRLVIAVIALVELSEPADAPGAISPAQAIAMLRADGGHDRDVLAAIATHITPSSASPV
jgi:diguanylate cyclase (GGDEF)-like protein